MDFHSESLFLGLIAADYHSERLGSFSLYVHNAMIFRGQILLILKPYVNIMMIDAVTGSLSNVKNRIVARVTQS